MADPAPTPGPTEAKEPSARPATGVFFCRCGPNLGNVIRLGELAEAAAWPGAADVGVHDVLCSEAGQAWLAERIRAGALERVVVAACSPREHEHTFRGVLARAGASPWLLQMVNLREQVEWVGGAPDAVTAKARTLVGAALRRVAHHRHVAAVEVPVSADVLVVGGGAAGVSAALALAQKDRRVVLAERAFVLGGLANQLDEIFPDLECASCFMEPVLDRVLHSERIEVLTGAEVTRVRGAEGSFTVELTVRPRHVDPSACVGCGQCSALCPADLADPYAPGLGRRKAIALPYAGCLPHVAVLDAGACLHHLDGSCDACAKACTFGAVRLDEAPRTREVTVGAIVLATGLEPGAVAGPEGLVSTFQLERMLHPDGPTQGSLRGAGGREPRAVLLAAAPDADPELVAQELLKLAHLVKGRLPGARVAVAGGLDRIPALAGRAAELAAEGVELLPGRLLEGAVIAAGAGLHARLVEAAGAGAVEGVVEADLVAVHAPSRPAAGTGALAALLRIETGEGGFLRDRAASPFEPTATRTAGVYVAGAAAGPRSIHQAIRDGAAAAGRVLASLPVGERRLLEPLAAEVDAALCGGCAICAAACPFGAITVEPGLGRARVEAVHCRGCGTCAAACPTGAAEARHYTREQISAELSALLAGGG